MVFLALAAVLTWNSPAPRAVPDAGLRVIRSANPRRRYVRLHLDIEGAGVRGSEISVYDLATGRTVDQVTAGPLSFGDGFDGIHVWSTDATGMPLIEGNADALRDVLALAHFLGRTGPERPVIRPLRTTRHEATFRVTYRSLSGPIDVTIERATMRMTRIEDRSGVDTGALYFHDYRRVGDTVIPFRIDTVSRYGAWHERVRAVEYPKDVPAKTFAPPAAPDDATLDGIATIPMRFVRGVPVVPIRIDDGPELWVLFDSGTSNFLKPRAARRAGLRPVGNDRTGGMGAGLSRQRYATAKRLRIGTAELRDQPFSVIDDDSFGTAIDGAIGCEVLQRFAARIDFRRRRIELTRDVERFAIGAPAIPVRLSACTPEIDGALDGIRGAFTIDTGSALTLGVNAPTVRRYGLRARYATGALERTGGGIGGDTVGYFAVAKSLRLGTAAVGPIPIVLSAMRAGAESDPSAFGNVGVPVLRAFDFVTVFDYRSRRMWLLR
jgi:hypothetical protein